ncbi:MAG TPA: hypothetical protein VJH23_00145 [archaeon]|nr:hypothetical protein [archaeon]
MDTFNFLLTTMLMMLAIQLHEPFIALGILVINILTSKDLSTIIAFIAVSAGLFLIIGGGWDDSWWLVAIFGIIVIAIVSGSKSAPAQPDMGLGGYGDLLGGMGGAGGY